MGSHADKSIFSNSALRYLTASSLQNSCSAEQLHYDCILKSYNSQKLKELQSKSNTEITDCRIAAL